MSMCICKSCGHWIDSDNDPDCFIETKYGDSILCETCREHDEFLLDEGNKMAAMAEDKGAA